MELWHLGFLLSIVFTVSCLPQSAQNHQTKVSNEVPALQERVGDTSCPGVFQLVGDHCLFFVTFMEQDKEGCREVCTALESKLVAIDSPALHRAIYKKINDTGLGTHNFWIDGSYDATNGWKFSSGDDMPVGTPFWGASETMSYPGDPPQPCAAITADAGYYIKDVACDGLYSALCQIDPISEADAGKDVLRTDADEDITSELASSNVKCPPFFINLKNTPRCTAFITWAKLSWNEARQICQSLQGDLLSTSSIDWYRSIYEYLHEEEIDSLDFWIGGQNVNTTSGTQWQWYDGIPIPMGTPFWGLSSKASTPGALEPDGEVEGENCLALTSSGKHFFRDRKCSESFYPLCIAMPIEQ